MALFRFYDPRIMAAFIGTLGASEALAFCGETDQIVTESAVVELAEETAKSGASGAVKAMPLTAPYVIKNQQMDAMSEVAGEEFKIRLRDYLRYVWWEEGSEMTNAELDSLIERSIEKCQTFDECPADGVFQIALAFLVYPKIQEREYIWKDLYENQGSGYWPLSLSGWLHPFVGKDRMGQYFDRLKLFNSLYSVEQWIAFRDSFREYKGPEGPYQGD